MPPRPACMISGSVLGLRPRIALSPAQTDTDSSAYQCLTQACFPEIVLDRRTASRKNVRSPRIRIKATHSGGKPNERSGRLQ